MHPCDIVEFGRFFDAIFRKKIYPFHYVRTHIVIAHRKMPANIRKNLIID